MATKTVQDYQLSEIVQGLPIPELTADATPDSAADYVITYDASATANKKVLIANLPTGGGGATVKQVTVTLPSPAKKSHAVVVTDAAVGAGSKLMLSLAGAPPTAQNEIEDIEMLSMGGLPAAGSFTFQAGFITPISGPILLNYMIG